MNQTPASPSVVGPFAVRDCALITLATGIRAQNLKEFRQGLQTVPAGSIYYHFWGRLLRAQFDEPEYNNDFASWAIRSLHDKPLAERLSMIVPSDFEDLEDLRQELLEVVEERLDEGEIGIWTPPDQQFFFLRSQLVVFDTEISCDRPADLVSCLPTLPTGSIYYHFIDARARTSGRCDDFGAWIGNCSDKDDELVHRLRRLDPYFSSLKELRRMITEVFQEYFEAQS